MLAILLQSLQSAAEQVGDAPCALKFRKILNSDWATVLSADFVLFNDETEQLSFAHCCRDHCGGGLLISGDQSGFFELSDEIINGPIDVSNSAKMPERGFRCIGGVEARTEHPSIDGLRRQLAALPIRE
jgi:hypothetical protein